MAKIPSGNSPATATRNSGSTTNQPVVVNASPLSGENVTKIHNNNAAPDSGRNQSVFVRGLQYFFKLIRSIFTRHSAEKTPAASTASQAVVKPAEQEKILPQSPPTLPAVNVDLTQYTIPEEFRDEIAKKQYAELDPLNGADTAAEKCFFAKRKQLQRDAEEYFSTLEAKVRPAIDTLVHRAATMKSEKTLIKCLYEKNQGVVIGEAHDSVASKHFIIDNIETLKAQGVTTLYLKHLFFDVHEKALRDYNSSPEQAMPDALKAYLQMQDKGHETDQYNQGYTFLNLVKTAHKAGIQVVALDCTTSYCLKGIEYNTAGTTHEQIMNYVAVNVITQHQAAHPGKWIALTGNVHMNHVIDTPGLAELTGTPGLHIIDSDSVLSTFRVSKDPGKTLDDFSYDMPLQKAFIKGDLLVEINTQNFTERLLNATYRKL